MAAVKLPYLNDFEAPSRGCSVGPLNYKRHEKKVELTEFARKDVANRKNGFNDAADIGEKIKLSLQDCLACSGCEEPVMTTKLLEQSVDQFLLNLSKGKAVIVSISPQSMASFAAHFSISPLQVLKKLITFFKSLGVKAVYDTTCGRDVALKEACNEFVARYKQSQCSDGGKCFPVISSACPGWISHAEKNLGSNNLCYISSVKSPQQMMGTILKRYLCEKLSIRLDEVYHVTVMPCYEKKVEAARSDFEFSMDNKDGDHKNPDQRFSEVDCVLTSSEVLGLIQSKSVNFPILDESPVDKMLTRVSDDGRLCGIYGSSGGYAETVFKHAAKSLFGSSIEGPLDYKMSKNGLPEVCLEVEGKTVLSFALCYGTRHLKKLTENIKSGKCSYHYLEIMTCPSGCLNGGGQIKQKNGASLRDRIQLVENAYMENVLVADPLENPITASLYNECLGEPGSEKAKNYVHTVYHPAIEARSLDW